jgi:hypothetical protein
MGTINYRVPRLSGAKAMIGALLATLAIAGVVQAAAPAPAAAMRSASECNGLLATIELCDTFGLTSFGDRIWKTYTKECV